MEVWDEPTWDEILMSAEIGGYQPDGDDREGDPTVAPQREPSRTEPED
jgi:hypothetical protein